MPKYFICRTGELDYPLGVAFVEPPKDLKDYNDWIFEKRCAIENFVKEYPEYAEDKNWLIAIPMPGGGDGNNL